MSTLTGTINFEPEQEARSALALTEETPLEVIEDNRAEALDAIITGKYATSTEGPAKFLPVKAARLLAALAYNCQGDINQPFPCSYPRLQETIVARKVALKESNRSLKIQAIVQGAKWLEEHGFIERWRQARRAYLWQLDLPQATMEGTKEIHDFIDWLEEQRLDPVSFIVLARLRYHAPLFSQKLVELAELTGVDRKTVKRVLSDFADNALDVSEYGKRYDVSFADSNWNAVGNTMSRVLPEELPDDYQTTKNEDALSEIDDSYLDIPFGD